MPEQWIYSGMENVDVGPPEIYINGRNIGWLNGEAKIETQTTTLPLKYGVPLMTKGQVVTERAATLTFNMLELTPENYRMLVGDGTLSEGGSTQWITVGNEAGTFGGEGTEESVVLAHHPVRDVIVRSSDEQTTYDPSTDFHVDEAQGIVFRLASGSITSGASVKISYEYSQSQTGSDIVLKFGSGTALETINNIIVHKYCPQRTGKQHQIWQIWKAQSNGNLTATYNTDTGSFITLPGSLNILADVENHPDSPYFQTTWADSFDINDYIAHAPQPGGGGQ